MELNKSYLIFLIIILIHNSIVYSRDPQLYIPGNIKNAYKNNSRSLEGVPGTKYWQNRGDYKLFIEFDPYSRLLKAEEEITYINNSPDTLKEIYINLFPNYYMKGQSREYQIDPDDENEGITISNILINNIDIDTSSSSGKLIFNGTNVKVLLDSFIPPHSKTQLYISWYYTVNKGSHNRTGGVDSTTFFVAYFFPHIAVYDDIDGWHDFNYTGLTEFYNDFGDIEAFINVPENFVVWATGLLQNPEEVLNKKYLDRYQAAKTSDGIVHIIDSTDLKTGGITKKSAGNAWHFRAENVSDFAFALSDHYLWDASSLIVDSVTGRRVLIDAAYSMESKYYFKVAGIARKCVEYMSFEFPAVPFPYPQMTVFNGKSEMEYPMMVNNWSMLNNPELDKYPDKDSYIIALTAHEIAHTYFPFYMGINESRHAWMDEGWAIFIDYHVTKKLYDGGGSPTWGGYEYIGFGELYNQIGGSLSDIPIIYDSEFIKNDTYHANSYSKPAYFYLILKDLLGDDLFSRTIKEYMNRWNGKHPTSYDFFFTLDNVSGENLNWLIKPWFFQIGYPDLAIKSVSRKSGEYLIEIEKVGNYPVPVHLKLTYDDGSIETLHEKVSVWKDGDLSYNIIDYTGKKLIKAELGDVIIPDINPSDNLYPLE